MNQEVAPRTHLSPTLILVLRLVWTILFVALLALFISGIPARYNELSTVCQAEPCVILTLHPEEAQAVAQAGLTLSHYAGYHIAIELLFVAIGGLLALLFFWRRFDEPMGILVAFMLLTFTLIYMVQVPAAYIRLHPELRAAHSVIFSLSAIPFLLLLFMFPDGRFVPSWTRYFTLLIAAVSVIEPLLITVDFTSGSGEMSYPQLFVTLCGILVGVGAQLVRYRHLSTPTQKQQTKWVILGFLSLLLPILGWALFIELFPLPPGLPRLLFYSLAFGIMATFLMFFPISFVIAITRYRLWDIDLIIRRTLVYSMLTGALVLVYFGSVVVVQTILGGVTGRGQNSQLTIVLSTLLIAALFNPLRRRVQDFIDRRFFRRKYDAAQTIANFAHMAGDEVELSVLTAELIQVVMETMQPEQVSLWLPPETKRSDV